MNKLIKFSSFLFVYGIMIHPVKLALSSLTLCTSQIFLLNLRVINFPQYIKDQKASKVIKCGKLRQQLRNFIDVSYFVSFDIFNYFSTSAGRLLDKN